jgi:hypothetical protein
MRPVHSGPFFLFVSMLALSADFEMQFEVENNALLKPQGRGGTLGRVAFFVSRHHWSPSSSEPLGRPFSFTKR